LAQVYYIFYPFSNDCVEPIMD